MATNKETPKRPHILLRILATVLSLALGLGAFFLVLYRDEYNLTTLEHWLTYRNLETNALHNAEPFTHAGGGDLSMAYLNDGIVFSSNSGTHYYSLTGELYTEEVLTMEHPILDAAVSSAVVYDAGGKSLFLFRQAQEVFRLELEGGGDLLSARVNNSGWLTVTAQQSGYKGAVTVYNADCKEVIEIRLSSSFVMDAALSPDCKTVAVVTMDQYGGSFTSQVRFYPINQTEPSSTISLGNAVVLDLDYESEQLWLLSEAQLMSIQTKDQELKRYSFGRSYLKGCDFGGDGFALLLLGRYRTGSATQAVTVGSNLTELASLPLDRQILDFDASNIYCSLLTGSELTIYTSMLVPYTVADTTQYARHTALNREGRALLASDQQAWLYIPNSAVSGG